MNIVKLFCDIARTCTSSALCTHGNMMKMYGAYVGCVSNAGRSAESSFLFLDLIGHLLSRLTFAVVNGSTTSLDRSKENTQVHVIGET